MVETPVLFVTFVRPDYARQTWEGIKATKPKTLYFYSNKGRAEKEGEVERNNEIRSYINEIDWDCDLHIFFREECVNVYDSLRGAIDWLFDNEERGIILEEDCVPTKAFFSFVDQMIEKFKEDKRVWCISGDNIKQNPSGYDYMFSHLHAMYGWASWRDRWRMVNWDHLYIKETIDEHIYYRLFKTKEQAKAKEKALSNMEDMLYRTKCWDYIFGLCMDQYHALTVQPKEHLVKNIGVTGQHHTKAKVSQYNCEPNPSAEEYVIAKEPPFVFADFEHDYLTYCQLLRKPSFFKRVKNRLSSLFER
mgnify:CR=1 FL=1